METLKLVRPSPEMEAQAAEYRAEHLRNGETELHGGSLLERMEYRAWLRLVRDNADPAANHAKWVAADTFFAVRDVDGRIVGLADIRHTLNAFLAAYGGHIGYGVRPSERGKGYG